MRHRFIAIEGPIGVGKSSFARQLADALGAERLLDPVADNPYVDAFYRQPRQVAMHMQLHCLTSRRQALETVHAAPTAGTIVSDFLFEKDRLFAELTLDRHEWAMYRDLYDRLADDLPVPDLVIYLQAPLERLVERLARRGSRLEAQMPTHYLEEVIAAHERLFHGWTRSPLLIVNAADIDLSRDSTEVDELIARIEPIDCGRHYLNAAPVY